ncbi:MAG TPA: hypothetical protein ENN73_02185 [Firmicutes bacterium]|nr:hypothetical protein [Bacillota bacterium]
MSFSENDFPGLIAQLEKAAGAYPDPAFSLEIVREIIRIFKRVPLYPGIAAACANKIVAETQAGKLKRGNFITVFPLKGVPFSGKVKSISEKEIKLDGNKTASTKNIKKIFVINTKVLEEDWPTLIFPEVK